MRTTIQTIQHDTPVWLTREINDRADLAALKGCVLRVIGFTHAVDKENPVGVYTAMVEYTDPRKNQLRTTSEIKAVDDDDIVPTHLGNDQDIEEPSAAVPATVEKGIGPKK